MDEFELEIKREFITEALMNLEETESSFMELESSSETKPLLDKIFRLAHNLKGGSRAVGFGDVAEFTHKLENLVLKIQQNAVQLNPQLITTLLKCNDRLIEMLNALKADLSASFDNLDLLTEIDAWVAGQTPEVAPKADAPVFEEAQAVAAQSASTEEVPPPSANAFFEEHEVAAAASVLPVPAPTPAETPAPIIPTKEASSEAPREKNAAKEDEVVRVSLSKINQLNDFVGEMIVLQSVIMQQAGQAEHLKVQASMRLMAKISKEVQNLAMSLRMLPVKPLIQKLQRVVRDTATALGKEVNLEVLGDQMDIDKSVLDQLGDPLIHILRNAVDHGLETTQERKDVNKDAKGKVHLNFFNEGNHLIIEIKDDGKGINADYIRKKAIEKKVITEAQTLSEKQLVNLIFHPGFSTKAVTSEISGRGVGMDVVKTNVEKIGGTVEVTTKVGSGSLFRLQIPLSLAVIEGMVINSSKERYVIPLNQVQETVNLKTLKIFPNKLGIGNCFELRGTIVPIVSLDEALGSKNSADDLTTALIVNVREQIVALSIRDILRTQQIVIKPLGNGVESRKGFVGSCVLGDGLPTLIISAVDLLHGRFAQSLGENRTEGVA